MLRGNGRRLRWLLVVVMVMAAFLGLTGLARAARFVEDRTIPDGQVIDDDVFIAAETVIVDGTVNGDLFATGGRVTINGTVKGSLFVMARDVVVNGDVRGSLYGMGASIEVGPSARVARNGFLCGYSIEAEAGSTIGRDLYVGAYQAFLRGNVEGDVAAGLGALEVDGVIGGDLKADVGAPGDQPVSPFWFGPGEWPAAVSPGLRIGPEAVIGGELVYTSPEPQDEAIESRPAGGIVHRTPVPTERDRVSQVPPRTGFIWLIGHWILARFRDLLTLLVLGLLALWLLPSFFRETADRGRAEPLPALLWGLVTLVMGCLAAAVIAGVILVVGLLLGLVTFGGLAGTVYGLGFSSLGFAFTVFVLLIVYGSKLVVAYLAGDWLLGHLSPQATERPIWPLLLGVLLYVVLRAVPILGWLIGLLVTLLGLGAIWLWLRDWYRSTRQEPAEA